MSKRKSGSEIESLFAWIKINYFSFFLRRPKAKRLTLDSSATIPARKVDLFWLSPVCGKVALDPAGALAVEAAGVVLWTGLAEAACFLPVALVSVLPAGITIVSVSPESAGLSLGSSSAGVSPGSSSLGVVGVSLGLFASSKASKIARCFLASVSAKSAASLALAAAAESACLSCTVCTAARAFSSA